MHSIALNITKNTYNRYCAIHNVQKMMLTKCVPNFYCVFPTYSTTIDTIETVANNLLQKHSTKQLFQATTYNNIFDNTDLNDDDLNNIDILTSQQLETIILDGLKLNNNSKIERIIKKCQETRFFISKVTFFKLLHTFSLKGNVNMVIILQSYCLALYPLVTIRNSKYNHYLARAQCMKGNSDQGLTLLKECYEKNRNIQGVCRQILRDLINDSVRNRSEASLVVFKKHVLDFSERLKDHYPILCFWHVCWTSNWFSDQMLATELLDISLPLRNIIKDRATHLCINILRNEYNEEAVMKLLQSLLKFEMVVEYGKILQILFGFKLKNGDVRGCKEIIHNCEALGIPLPSSQQSRFIEMIIDKDDGTSIRTPKNFKLKF